MAVQTILVHGAIAYIFLRLSFGGSVNPPSWCGFSEMLCDLSNEITLIKDWDPDELHSPLQPTTPTPIYEDSSVPYAKARELAVEVPTTSNGRGDVFIDDVIRIFLATNDLIKKNTAALPLALHVSMRPLSNGEPHPRKEVLSMDKLHAEGIPNEVMAVLGWLIHTRRLILSLPDDKHERYKGEIKEILAKEEPSWSREMLESLIGKFTHSSYVIPLSRHFLSRLRSKLKYLKKINAHGKRMFRLSLREIEDLKLWDALLDQAHDGISLNGLTLRNPTRLGFSDSCPQGLGGYTHAGRAWRLKINPKAAVFNKDVANNLLEFLGMAINLWLSLKECEDLGLEDELILILGDNTSAISWLFKSSLPDESIYKEAVIFIARKIAMIVLKSKNFIASQHVPGKRNVIADWLSFEGTDRMEGGEVKDNPVAHDYAPNDIVTHRIVSNFSQLVPECFEISQLPSDIYSFACQALRIFESSLMRKRKLESNLTTESSDDGEPFVKISSTDNIPILMEYPATKPTSSFGPSSKFTEDPDLLSQEKLMENVRQQWRDRLSKKSSALWARRCGTISNGVRFTRKETEIKN